MNLNGVELDAGQQMTLRTAIESFDAQLANEGLGDDEHGKKMTVAYRERLAELRQIIQSAA